jgi:hypothetical protein
MLDNKVFSQEPLYLFSFSFEKKAKDYTKEVECRKHHIMPIKCTRQDRQISLFSDQLLSPEQRWKQLPAFCNEAARDRYVPK